MHIFSVFIDLDWKAIMVVEVSLLFNVKMDFVKRSKEVKFS